MNREQRLTMADEATTKAANLARDAEDAARGFHNRDKAEPLAAVGALWADIARSHAAIAATLPETENARG
ncbi:hypothetical protein PV518_42850 [Streptomyces sp. ND04-05B]|uniref:hypothetical protein n=1 Tax=Streptomyces sp. ND04-05B TaxID=3028693 RepID=UPI0029A5730B|nr:hypothetical protein [Streptomyces sp. ND04-05B]MDX3068810.1 hypothetical protein [Streptomyces sp. ND04-05B]